MIVSIFIKSESSDSYLYLFKDKTPKEIYSELHEDLEMFCPISESFYRTLDASKQDKQEIDRILDKLDNESWDMP